MDRLKEAIGRLMEEARKELPKSGKSRRRKLQGMNLAYNQILAEMEKLTWCPFCTRGKDEWWAVSIDNEYIEDVFGTSEQAEAYRDKRAGESTAEFEILRMSRQDYSEWLVEA